MRIAVASFAALALSAVLWGQAPSTGAPVSANGNAVASPAAADSSLGNPPANPAAAESVATPAPAQPGATIITAPPTRDAITEAKRQFAAGTKLRSAGDTQAAFEKFQRAAQLDPRDVEFAKAREFARQQLVKEALERGNQAMLAGNDAAATAEFQRALEIDGDNEFARQRLRDATWQASPAPSRTLQVAQKSIEVALSPSAEHKDFHYHGDSRNLLTQVAHAYGITATLDDSVQTRQLHFDIDNVTFAQAMEAATQATKTFWIALSGSQMYVVSDTAENRRNFERTALRTFYLSDIATPQEMTEMVNALRVLLDIRMVQQNASESTITVRAPLPIVEAAGHLLESLAGGRPQLMLDVRVYQISSSLVKQLGTVLPSNFTLFNITPALVASLGVGASDLVNQLIASGGINQANSQAIQALLAQLQQSTQSSLLAYEPFATFGGGKSFMGLTAKPITVNLSVNESDVRGLEHVTLLASQNVPAVLKVGERYPIVNATFAPIYNTAAISRVLGNQTYRAPFPSINYEDLGLNLKATPIIHSNAEVSLKIEINIRTLGGQNVNGIPIVNNREYVGSITLKNEESGVVAGMLSKADSASLAGYPFLSRVPAVTYAAAVHDKNVNNDELLVVITPHITRMAPSEGFALQLPVGH